MMKPKKSFLCVIFILFCCFFEVFGQPVVVPVPGTVRIVPVPIIPVPVYSEPKPEREKRVDEHETSITIRCNVDAEIYLNGVYQGRSDLIIKNLIPGSYNLELRKNGFETEYARIFVRHGVSQEFSFRLRKETGFLRIDNLPVGAEVHIDGMNYYSSIVELGTGYHSVTVRKFGYRPYETTVMVYPHCFSEIDVYLELAEFELTKASVSRKIFNPDYTGAAGTLEVRFYVTADSWAKIEVFDSEYNVVYIHEFDHFNTWNQSFVWNGHGQNGDSLSDGKYTIILTSPVSKNSWNVEIDRTLSFPLLSLTNSGAGTGTLPVVLHNRLSYFMPTVSGGMNFSTWNGAYSGFFKGGVLFNLGNHFELGISGGGYPLTNGEGVPALFNFNGRVYTDCYLGEGIYYTLGGLVRYGFWTKELFGEKGVEGVSADTGAGLGFGIVNGFDFGLVYLGLSDEFTFGSRTGNVVSGDYIFRNGLVFDFMPSNLLNAGAWFAVNSDISQNWFLAIDAGFELNFMPGMSGFVLSLRNKNLFYTGKRSYFSVEIGLSYLF